MSDTGNFATLAPFLSPADEVPKETAAYWVHASDGVRLRIGQFGQGPRGTILCFPGRTEYVEKYARIAQELKDAGFGMLAIDWRGQGLADRLTKNPLLGHVDRFADYQKDVEVYVEFAERQNMPRPWYLLAHSMGGAIGLRALSENLKVSAAVFSAPMWGLVIPPLLRPLASSLPALTELLGYSGAGVPFTGNQPYVLTAKSTDNLLTSDPESFKWFRKHVRTNPSLALGTPTMRWLREAMREFERFRTDAPPCVPCQIHLGGDEAIVSPQAIHDLAARWQGADLSLYDGGRHEVLMERPHIRDAILDKIKAALPA